jgi:hypothetical protein
MGGIGPKKATGGARDGVQWGSDDSIMSVPIGHAWEEGMFRQEWEDAPARGRSPRPRRAALAPVERWVLPYGLRGIPVQFVAELWRDEDAASPACPHGAAAIPDPHRSGYSWVIMLVDLATGEVSLPLSPGQVAAWPGMAPAAGKTPRRRPRS